MTDSTATNKPGILYVDDEEKALKYFAKAFARDFCVFTASSAKEGLNILENESDAISLIISDQRMPETTGVEFLSRVYALYPNKIRILTTAYSDLDSAIQSVNQGRIYQYIVKPWDLRDLQMVLRRAFDFYSLLTERNELMSIKMSTFQRIILADRTKTLQVLSGAIEGQPGKDLLIGLSALVNALPSLLDTNPAGSGNAFMRGGIQDLMRQERTSHETILQFWKSSPDSASECLSLLATALDQLPGVQHSTQSTDKQIDLTIQSEETETASLLQSLFGILVEPKPSALSLYVFKLLPLLARSTGTLHITINGDTVVKIAPSSEIDHSALEGELNMLYDKWDSKSL